MAEIDIEALRREAKGDGRECVPVTRRFLAAVLERIEAPAALDTLGWGEAAAAPKDADYRWDADTRLRNDG